MNADAGATYERAVRAIECVCLGFAIFGMLLPLAYATPPFALYRAALVAGISDARLAVGSPTVTLCLGMTGGAIAGKWVAHYAVARLGLRRRERWARTATLAGLFGWFGLDSGVSLAAGAWPNVLLVNPLPPLLLLPLLARVWRGCDRTSARGATPVLVSGAMLAGVASGLAIALGGDGPLFAPWRSALAAAHFGETSVPNAARALVRWFLGPIGGTTFGHFLLLVWLVRYAGTVGRRAAYGWALASILIWFVIDSGWSLAAGAAFNVALVNAPALLATGLPLAWMLAAARHDPTPPAIDA